MESGNLLPSFASKLADSKISAASRLTPSLKVVNYFHVINRLFKDLLF